VRPHLEVPPVSNAPIPLTSGDESALLLSTSDLMLPTKLRLLVFAPHPDDETIAAGGLIQQVLAGGGAVRVVFVTNGDGYVEAVRASVSRSDATGPDFVAYGQRRHDEALRALQRLGLRPENSRFLGFPDDGIDDLWSGNWFESEPYTSPHTRFSHPPYIDSVRPDLEYDGVDLESQIRLEVEQWRPDWILTPDPRDHHPDHCTTAVFVLEALRQMQRQSRAADRPVVLGYLVHATGYPASVNWLSNIANSGVGGSSTASRTLQHTEWLRLPLSSSQQEEKRLALAAYDSQLRAMRPFLVQFLRDYELFSRLDEGHVLTVPRDYAARFGRTR
jgi:LmbE family N-acetylglucosaminyl deacetylase